MKSTIILLAVLAIAGAGSLNAGEPDVLAEVRREMALEQLHKFDKMREEALAVAPPKQDTTVIRFSNSYMLESRISELESKVRHLEADR